MTVVIFPKLINKTHFQIIPFYINNLIILKQTNIYVDNDFNVGHKLNRGNKCFTGVFKFIIIIIDIRVHIGPHYWCLFTSAVCLPSPNFILHLLRILHIFHVFLDLPLFLLPAIYSQNILFSVFFLLKSIAVTRNILKLIYDQNSYGYLDYLKIEFGDDGNGGDGSGGGVTYNPQRGITGERIFATCCKIHCDQHRITRGCPQGSVLRPKLWNLVMDTLLRELTGMKSTLPDCLRG